MNQNELKEMSEEEQKTAHGAMRGIVDGVQMVVNIFCNPGVSFIVLLVDEEKQDHPIVAMGSSLDNKTLTKHYLTAAVTDFDEPAIESAPNPSH